MNDVELIVAEAADWQKLPLIYEADGYAPPR